MAFLIVAGLPCLALILSLLSRFCCGPFWLGANNDPSYLYFMNSLYLADHKMPTFNQHPGTPLEILGAVVIRILSFPAQGQAIVEDALKRPEYYLSGIYTAVLLFYIITLGLLGWYAYRQTKNGMFALLVQSPFFLYLMMTNKQDGMLPVLANVCAESLLIGLLNIYVLCLLRVYFNEKNRSLLPTAIGWGVVGGFLVATKVISLPLLLMPVIILGPLKTRLFYVLAVILSFFTATLPIWPRFPSIFSYLSLMMTHTKYLGNGSAGFIDWPIYLKGLASLFQWQWVLMASAAFALIFVLVRCLGGSSGDARARGFGACIAGTVVLQFLMVGKEPQNHYMVPAIGLFGVLWAFVYLEAGGKILLWAGAGIIFVLVSIFGGIACMRSFYASSRETMEFSQKIYSRFDQCIVCGFYRSSSVPFALEFGDDNAGRKAYGEIIQKLYPQHYFMGVLEKRFDDGKGLIYGEDLLAQSPCLLLYGSASEFINYNGPLLKLQLLVQQGNEALFRVLGARDRQARQFLYMAQLAMLQGHGQIAYMLGMRAQALGLPAAQDFFNWMNDYIAKSQVK